MFSFPEVCTLAVGAWLVCGVQLRYQVVAVKEICTLYQVGVYLFNRISSGRLEIISVIHYRMLTWSENVWE